MRKLLALVLTVSTMVAVVTAVQKLKRVPEQPVSPPAVVENKTTPLPPAPPKPDKTPEQVSASISAAELKAALTHLAGPDLEGRMSGKKGNRLAADYIEGKFKGFGLKTMRQKFPMGRYNPGPKNEQGDDFSENVIGYVEGVDPAVRDQIVVVGAHMDHLGYGPRGSMATGRTAVHPGADDNASGTVALMEIARGFSMIKDKVKRTTVFIAFSGEEMGLVGSKYYCGNPLFPAGSPSISKHVAMINMDMIGYLKVGRSQPVFFNEGSSVDLDKAIGELNGKYSFAKSISGRGAGGSDHAPFYNMRVPVVCLHTGQHRLYHTPEDTAERINYDGLEQVTRYAFELCWRVANGQSPPAFNHAGFRVMTYDNDHGYDPSERK
jgi:Zn-dependent M28 family amino/carboxypeptidase